MSAMDLRRQRIHEAHQAGLRNRMRDGWHIPERRVDELLQAWTVEAARRGLPPSVAGYWAEAERWIRDALYIRGEGQA
jgi:hypothetical protein